MSNDKPTVSVGGPYAGYAGSLVVVDLSATETGLAGDELRRGRVLWGDGDFTDVIAPFTTASHSYMTPGAYVLAFHAYTGGGRAGLGETTVTILGDQHTTYQATVTLTDAQIKALPTTHVVVLPATEPTTEYATVPVPVSAFLLFKTSDGGYSNVHADNYLVLGSGSDWSNDYSQLANANGMLTSQLRSVVSIPVLGTTKSGLSAPNNPHYHFAQTMLLHLTSTDNAIVLGVNNGGSGNFTGGHANNTLTVTVLYCVLNISTGLFV